MSCLQHLVYANLSHNRNIGYPQRAYNRRDQARVSGHARVPFFPQDERRGTLTKTHVINDLFACSQIILTKLAKSRAEHGLI